MTGNDDVEIAEALHFEAFEWDEAKRAANLELHGIDFVDAARIFDGPVLQIRSDRDGEVRWIAIGRTGGSIISVIYTKRSKRCRIISARASRRAERSAYSNLFEG